MWVDFGISDGWSCPAGIRQGWSSEVSPGAEQQRVAPCLSCVPCLCRGRADQCPCPGRPSGFTGVLPPLKENAKKKGLLPSFIVQGWLFLSSLGQRLCLWRGPFSKTQSEAGCSAGSRCSPRLSAAISASRGFETSFLPFIFFFPKDSYQLFCNLKNTVFPRTRCPGSCGNGAGSTRSLAQPPGDLMLPRVPRGEFSPVCRLKHSLEQPRAGGLPWGTGCMGDAAPAKRAAQPWCPRCPHSLSQRLGGNSAFAEGNQQAPVWVCGRWDEQKTVCHTGG